MKNVLVTATLLMIGSTSFAQGIPAASCYLHETDLATGKMVQESSLEFTAADNKNDPKIPVQIFEIKGTKVRFEYAVFRDATHVVLKAFVGPNGETEISTSSVSKATLSVRDAGFVTSIICK